MIAVISAGRPGNVERMHDLIGTDEIYWYVGPGERAAYTARGADVQAEGGLVECRNLALEDAFAYGAPCIQVSDDLARVEAVHKDGTMKEIACFEWAAHELLSALREGVHLAGTAPTNNLFFYPGRAVDEHKFIVADLIAVAPCPLRFDPAFTLKEDYDYTAQHLAEYGKVARCNRILPTFAHRTNRGGAVAYRNAEMEQRNIARLRAKWGDWIQDNPRRPNEILLRYKPQGCLL